MTDLTKGRILVTGGAGFIGSALIWELNRRGHQNILVADLLRTDDKWKNLVALRFADYIEADQLEERIEHTPNLFDDIKAIFHLGACSATTERDASYLIRNNFEWTKKLAHFALARNARFIYASSAATYGEDAAGISEDVPLEKLRPLNMYGYSKHLFDLYAQNAGMLNRITGVKYFNAFGPNESHKADMRSVVHKAYQQIRSRGVVSLFKSYRPEYADGGQKRDFFYVKDAVDATLFLGQHVAGGGLFNLGSGEANTWIALVTPIFAALGMEANIEFVDMPEALRSKYQYLTTANIAKLRAAGFTRPMTPLSEAVTDYVKNYLAPGLNLGEHFSSEHPSSEHPSSGTVTTTPE
jgi:ADP-L-glycero-D-manno-heptose 6-epimerase